MNVIKKIITISLGITLMVSNSFGYTSDLIVPKNGKKIIDIGTPEPIKKTDVKIPKDYIEIGAQVRAIDNLVYLTDRELSEKWDCISDNLGHENCSQDLTTCNINPEISNGTSAKVDKEITKNKWKIAVPRAQAVSPNTVNGNLLLMPNAGAIDGATFTVSADGTGTTIPSPSTLMSQGYVNSEGKFAVKIFSFTSGSGGFFFNQAASSIDFVLNNGHTKQLNYAGYRTGVGGGNGLYSVSIITWDTPPASLTYLCDDYCVMSPPDDPELGFWGWGCDQGFSAIDSINGPTGQCKKRYSYYNYSCPNDSNVYGAMQGPLVNTGGDCLGTCGPDNCACNSATPPTGNCYLADFTCPIDNSKVCTKTSDTGTTYDNYADKFIYSTGTSVEHNKTKTAEKTCKEGMTLSDGKCIKSTSYSCMQPGFSFNEAAGECVKTPDCDGGVIDTAGNCIKPKTYDCAGSYTYDAELGKCKENSFCDKGTLSLLTHKCEAAPEGGMCDSGFSLNTERARCEKAPITKQAKSCNLAGAPYSGAQPFLAMENTCIYSEILIENIPTDEASSEFPWGGILTPYAIHVGNKNFSFKVLNAGTYVISLQIDNYGSASINGTSILSVNNWPTVATHEMYLSAGTHSINVNGANVDGPEGMAATIVEKSTGTMLWNTRYGQNIEYCPTAPNVIKDDVKGYCTYQMQCNAGYTYNLSNDVCYINDPSSEEDFPLNVYGRNPSCAAGPISGSFLEDTGFCSFNPSCANSGTFLEDINQCTLNATKSCDAGSFATTTTLPGLSEACQVTELCPVGSYRGMIEVNNQLVEQCIGGKTPDCGIDEILNSTTMQCEGRAYCPQGFKELTDGTCKQDYLYYTYHCEAPFEGPNMPGEDCDGKCGGYGCSCNASTPLPNNCKKPFTFTPVVETLQKRAMIKHAVTGSLTPFEFGQQKGYSCGDNCLYTVNKISGDGSNLCFEKRNGEKGCFTIENCFFRGSISNELGIRELQVGGEDSSVAENLYQYSLAEGARFKIPQVANNDDISCYDTITHYNPLLRMCENDTSAINFSSWIRQGAGAGTWTVSGGGSTVYQSVNGNPTYFMSPDSYGKSLEMSGKFKVVDNDDDWAGIAFGWNSINDFYLFDWKSADQGTSEAGLRLLKVHNGNGANIGSPTSTSEATVLASNYNYAGWNSGTQYTLGIKYEKGKIQAFVNGVKQLEYIDPNLEIEGGKIGFYNFSQPNVTYSDFYMIAAPKCPVDYDFDTSSKLCLKIVTATAPENTIHSTCKMNGHVGWVNNSTGLVSAKVGDQIDFSIPDTMGIPDLVSGIDTDSNLTSYDKSHRIEFWDPYVDKYLGFLEFVKDVKNEDRQAGFHPKNERAYDLGEHGFTAIGDYGLGTYYVSAETIGVGMTESECDNAANKYGLTRVSNPTSLEAEYLKRLAGNRFIDMTLPASCSVGQLNSTTGLCDGVLPDAIPFLYCKYGTRDGNICSVNKRCMLKEANKLNTFNMYDEAFKVLSSSGTETYKCAPLTCKDHFCQEATCQDGYSGTLHNASDVISATACQDQTCDYNKEHNPYCGKTGGCPRGNNIAQEGIGENNTGNDCFEYYCEEGSYISSTKKCKVFACPSNTIESSSGDYCIRK